MLIPEYHHQRQFFDEQAPNWRFPEEDRKKVTQILKSIDLPASGIILDAGCGAGNLFPVLRTIVPEATILACDISEKMLSECRWRYPQLNIPLWLGFCEELPLKTASVDLILNYCLFPHIRNKATALAEFRRTLKPGGQYLIIHPNGRSETNQKHRQIGTPVRYDLLPPIAVINENLHRHSFRTYQIIDCDDLFFIAASKEN